MMVSFIEEKKDHGGLVFIFNGYGPFFRDKMPHFVFFYHRISFISRRNLRQAREDSILRVQFTRDFDPDLRSRP
jgi:hypothetical protein